MRTLLRPRWLLAHALTLALIVCFLLLGWWQVRRAAAGNVLSFGYALQWPTFAAFVTYVWAREVRLATRQSPARGQPPGATAAATAPGQPPRSGRQPSRTGPAYDDSDDAELAEYNRYLAWLSANPQAPASPPAPSQYPDRRSS